MAVSGRSLKDHGKQLFELTSSSFLPSAASTENVRPEREQRRAHTRDSGAGGARAAPRAEEELGAARSAFLQTPA